MENKPVIILRELDVYQQERCVLEKVNMQLAAGEWVYLIGKVGSGKTSLIRLLNAELPVLTGEASVAGWNLGKIKWKEIPLLRRKLGVVFQDFKLLADRTIHDNLSFVLRATGWRGRVVIENRIREVIRRVEMEGNLERMPHELSGGEQQRVVIARALLNNPEIILADEPTGNLDPETSAQLMQIFREINAQGKTILMATHDYLMLNRFPARILLCSGGRITNA
ncbi:MAG: cell division ATP-binding protein FtsE [Mangrovibacterium sp.]